MRNWMIFIAGILALTAGIIIGNIALIIYGSITSAYSLTAWIAFGATSRYLYIWVKVIQVKEHGEPQYYVKRYIRIMGMTFWRYIYTGYDNNVLTTFLECESIEKAAGFLKDEDAKLYADQVLHHFSSKKRLGVSVIYSTTTKKELLSDRQLANFDKKNQLFMELLKKDENKEDTKEVLMELRQLHTQ